ncbi:MAG: hypothetical protein CSA09_01445 [Candidatus Contendobacter odensis]|uniref:Uncharacterized protein n=1 Tax=Candidatus Contendibacter odensensis TaxID=1400860 RepID=A0A2G6PGI0_9GAMM|nr:MAG: hypothetical protein CSA09_01445 [Candidatus Contendobacter odensis]
MTQMLTVNTLEMENQLFSGTGGVSQENQHTGFLPGFLDQDTGDIYPSCRSDGIPAAIHILDGLPNHLILARDPTGRVIAAKTRVIAGFIRQGCFYTREQAASRG